MNAAATTDPRTDLASLRPDAGATRRGRGPRASVRITGSRLHWIALGAVLAASLGLRLWGIKQGLPYSYNADEATHFVPKAVGFFGHDLNPHYFLNPPGYSYLLFIVFELWFGSADAVRAAYVHDPTAVFVLARLVAAVLGTAAVALTYLAGSRLLGRTVGLLAAAILGFAFLPVFYSHLALNDVPTLTPVALSLYGIAEVLRGGRTRAYVLAGAGVGLAAAFKYTGGITLVCLLVASAYHATTSSRRTAARRCSLALLVALAAFLVANPYALLDPSAFFSGVSSQASLAAGQDPVKLGSHPGGVAYYMWTFTWGLGWGPALAALAGAVLLALRRRIGLVLVFLPAVVAFVIFMGDQQRFFGRWLMPVFPIVCVLAAYGAVEAAGWLTRTRRVPVWMAAPLVAVLMLAQSAVAVVHNDAVLSRPDTRNLARGWMVTHVPAGSKVVIEPLVPDGWASDIGTALSATRTGERWSRWPTWLTTLDSHGNQLPAGQHRFVLVDQYERYLYPGLLDRYVANGYCWVVIGSLQAGRAFAAPQAAPNAIAYYAQLAQRARLMYHVSPFSAGARPVPFSFDWSIDYYPRQYHRPGPELSVYRLTQGRCAP